MVVYSFAFIFIRQFGIGPVRNLLSNRKIFALKLSLQKLTISTLLPLHVHRLGTNFEHVDF